MSVTDERVSKMGSAAIGILATTEDLSEPSPRMAQAGLALVRDRQEWQRYAASFDGRERMRWLGGQRSRLHC